VAARRDTLTHLRDFESKAVGRWRKTVLSVAIEEMAHLAQVNNLLVALGGAPQFNRPNLPVPPGYHPSGFVIRLVPFTKATLDHFIYLERPVDEPAAEGAGRYRLRAPVQRTPTPGDITPSTPDYETIGEFYAEIRSMLTAFAEACSDAAFLPSSVPRQIGPGMAGLPGLIVIRDLGDALATLDTVFDQGEGSSSAKEDCHFALPGHPPRMGRARGGQSRIRARRPGGALSGDAPAGGGDRARVDHRAAGRKVGRSRQWPLWPCLGVAGTRL
jgi:hypothetical protein